MTARTRRQYAANDPRILATQALLRSGKATMAEVAALVGTSRQQIALWTNRAGINAVETRRAYLRSEWKEALIIAKVVAALVGSDGTR